MYQEKPVRPDAEGEPEILSAERIEKKNTALTATVRNTVTVINTVTAASTAARTAGVSMKK